MVENEAIAYSCSAKTGEVTQVSNGNSTVHMFDLAEIMEYSSAI